MLNFVRAWIFFAALLNVAGWVLSACHQLNQPGYLVVFLLALVALGWWGRDFQPFLWGAGCKLWHKLSRRFRRPAPLIFLVLALMSLAGGALYVPTNIDTNAYRIPRVLHWLGQGQWHWIHTYDPRFNSTGTGFEWLAAPLILFTHTDRFLFLINWVSYLMLPGLIFDVFTRLQVRPRVAWWWMWFLSSGWCFTMQAGSTGNDSFAAIYALAAVSLVLRAKERKSIGDFWLSMLAAALLTGVKQTNMPLVLPWLIAAGCSLKLLRARPLATVAVGVACLLVSAVPVSIGNLVHHRDWMGFSRNVTALENPLWTNGRFDGSPIAGIVGNTFDIAIQNLVPPYFPFAERWDEAMQHFVQTPLGAHFASFDHFGRLPRFSSELTAGVGLGICLLTLMAICGASKYRYAGSVGEVPLDDGFFRWLRLASWVALLVFMAKIGSFAAGRYLTPYYPLLFPLILTRPGHSRLVRQKWWQGLGVLLMLFAAALLVVSQNRPLFPVRLFFGRLQQDHPYSHLASSVSRYYAVESLSYGRERNPLEKKLPKNEGCIGYTSAGGLFEPALWLPLGHRRVELACAEDTPQQLRQLGLHYVVVEDMFLSLVNETIEQWMNRYNAELIDEATFQPQPSQQVIHVYLVELRSE
ncbi:MAG: hypothetical protein ACLQAH_14485 [Limisphaerales bacterium]